MDNGRDILIAPSLLSADFSAIADAVTLIQDAGGDWIHLDVMDGAFVPNITFGTKMVSDIRKRTALPLDVHLMIQQPELYIDQFAEAGGDIITFHFEAAVHAHRLLQRIRSLGKLAGISIVPSTPAHMLNEIVDMIDIVLVMTVNPGFGGQKLIPSCVEKVRTLDMLRNERDCTYKIAVDGGIYDETAALVIDAGADVLITGSTFFSSENPGDLVVNLKARK